MREVVVGGVLVEQSHFHMEPVKAVSTVVKVCFNVFAFLIDCDSFSSLFGFVSLSFLSLTLVSWEAVSCLFLVVLMSRFPGCANAPGNGFLYIGSKRVALNTRTLKVW